jgi:hypothetical protein
MLRSLRSLVQGFNTAQHTLSPNRHSILSQRTVLCSLVNTRSFNMSSAVEQPAAGNKRRRPQRRKPRDSRDIPTTGDPHRASLATRLAVPSDTPVVSSFAPTPAIGATPAVSRPESPSYKANFSTVRFEDFVTNGQISKQQHANIPFEFATEVQAKTLGHILAGKDV